jgi:hypothetical protein
MTEQPPSIRGRIAAHLDLVDCAVRLTATVATQNWVAAWNTFVDVEDAHRRLGHDYNQVSKDRPFVLPPDEKE